MGLQRVGHDPATEQQQARLHILQENDNVSVCKSFSWIKGAELNPHFLYDFGTSINGHMTKYQEQTVVV